MPFSTLSNSAFHRVPHLEGGPENVFFTDVFGTPQDSNYQNPLTGSLFLLESTKSPSPAPPYDYDETGVVIRGQLNITDESGRTASLQQGDTFFINRGSVITFTTPSYAVAFKAAARWRAKL